MNYGKEIKEQNKLIENLLAQAKKKIKA